MTKWLTPEMRAVEAQRQAARKRPTGTPNPLAERFPMEAFDKLREMNEADKANPKPATRPLKERYGTNWQ